MLGHYDKSPSDSDRTTRSAWPFRAADTTALRMSRFPTDRHAASWAAVCPGNDESAGKRRSGRTRSGNPHLRAALVEAACAAIRTKDTYRRAQ